MNDINRVLQFWYHLKSLHFIIIIVGKQLTYSPKAAPV